MTMPNKPTQFLSARSALLASLIFASPLVFGHGKPEVGHASKAADADRTVEVTMGDIFFEPKNLSVEGGETIRFVVKNAGQLIHEFNIGTAEMHMAHREEMTAMMKTGALTATGMDHSKMDHSGMKHDDPNSVLVEPGQTLDVTWTFPKAGELQFACNVPGHYEAGMVGDFNIRH